MPRPFNKGKNSLVNQIAKCKRRKLDLYLTPHTKINSKWIKELNVSSSTIKLLEEIMGQKLHDTGFGIDFLDMTAKHRQPMKKIDKLDFMKIKNFCASKDTIHRVRSSPQNGRSYLQIICLINGYYPE